MIALDPTSPICGVNEIARDCRKICPPQTCLSRLALYKCRSDIPCEPGCDCIPNYLRNSKGVCIPADKCESSKSFYFYVSKIRLQLPIRMLSYGITFYMFLKENKHSSHHRSDEVYARIGCEKLRASATDYNKLMMMITVRL